jgi:hypothetical protein
MTYQLLTQLAARQQKISYQEAKKIIGFSDMKELFASLNEILEFCKKERIPPLHVLVVSEKTGFPGPGVTDRNDFDRQWNSIFDHIWHRIVPPVEWLGFERNGS